jgi:chromosome segregation ATPase
MKNFLYKIRTIVQEFETLTDEEKSLHLNLLKVNEKREKVDKVYAKLVTRIDESNASIEELDVDITRLKETKYIIDHYEEFKMCKKRMRILQIAIVIGICSILILPLIGINIIAYLELILLGTAFKLYRM